MTLVRHQTPWSARCYAVVSITAGLLLGSIFVDCATRHRSGQERLRALAAACRERGAVLVQPLDTGDAVVPDEPRCAHLLAP